MIVQRLVVCICFAGLVSAASAGEAAYWTCDQGQWIAVGEPDYPRPLRDCIEKPAAPKTEARCDALGGTWKPIGIFPRPVCRMQTRDAGRICGDADECDGTCLAPLTPSLRDMLKQHRPVRTLGRCSPAYPAIGCLAIVEKNAVRQLLCLD